MLGGRLGEGSQVGHGRTRITAVHLGHPQQVPYVRRKLVGGILGHEALQQRHRLVEAPLLDERARQVEGGRRGQRVRGPGVDELAERLGRLGVLLLELRPRQAVLRLGCERRGRIGLQDGLVRGPRVGETAETKEGFALPELHLERPARRWLKGLRAFEGLERRFVVADGQPGASEQQYGVGQARVLGELLDESLQRTTGNRHDAVGRRALADKEEAVGLLHRTRGREGEEREEEERQRRDAAALHDDPSIVARYPTAAVRLCVFDLDHTLIRSPLDLAAMALDMRARLEVARGLLPPRSDRYRVSGLITHCRRDAPALLDTLWAIALDDERRALDGTSLEPGARDALEGARAAGFAVALWTNNAREITADVLDRFGLLGGFDLIVTRDEMDALKPDPAGWRVIRERFGDCAAVVVGDSWVDGVAAAAAGVPFVAFSAVLSGVKEIRQVIAEADVERTRSGRRTILFVDEIHRFNRAQQDAFLPHVEKGTVVLVGATTENPSFEVNGALLSRCRVYVLHGLAEDDLLGIMRRALTDRERGLAALRPEADDDALRLIARLANGDARAALNMLELAVTMVARGARPARVTDTAIREAAQKKTLLYDKSGEEHYNLISALHKSLRDSDPDASLYWMTRMLESGEDPLYVARRLVRFASEDVGNADPVALTLTLAAKDAYDFLGSPEGELALAQATLYLALAPKSNAVYTAYNEAKADVEERPTEPVPLHIRNAPTGLMKGLGYGRGYQYAHDAEDARVDQEHLPEALRDRQYYQPTERGLEAELGRRLAEWRRWRAEQRNRSS